MSTEKQRNRSDDKSREYKIEISGEVDETEAWDSDKPWMDEDNLRSAISATETLAGAAFILGTDSDVVRMWADRLGIDIERSSTDPERPWTDEGEFRRVAEGDTDIRIVSEAFGASAITIARWSFRHGVPVDGRERYLSEDGVPVSSSDIRSALLKSRSMEEASEEFGVSRSTVRRWCDIRGIEPRRWINNPYTKVRRSGEYVIKSNARWANGGYVEGQFSVKRLVAIAKYGTDSIMNSEKRVTSLSGLSWDTRRENIVLMDSAEQSKFYATGETPERIDIPDERELRNPQYE